MTKPAKTAVSSRPSPQAIDADQPRLIFLDMDGVCCSERATLVLGPRCVDPMAVQFLNRLHQACPYQLVASSSWRKDYYLPVVLEAVGCVAPFAKPWKIETDAERPRAIAEWLANYAPAAEFIILDDERFDWLPEQRERWICCDAKNGMGLDEMRRAFDIFGASPHAPEADTGVHTKG